MSKAGVVWALLRNTGRGIGRRRRQNPLVFMRMRGKQSDGDSPRCWGRSRGTGSTPAPRGSSWVGEQHLHDVVELQPCVRRGIDQDVGQGVLVVIHLICERRGKGW